MAENYDSLYVEYEKEIRRGHCVCWSYPAHQFLTLSPWEFRHLYHTHCQSIPTSWEIVIKPESEQRNSCLVSLRRTDTINRPLVAYIHVSFRDIHKQPLAVPKIFTERNILPFGEVKGFIEQMIPQNQVGSLAGQMVIVEVAVYIFNCHEKIEPYIESLNSDLNRMKFSKL